MLMNIEELVSNHSMDIMELFILAPIMEMSMKSFVLLVLQIS